MEFRNAEGQDKRFYGIPIIASNMDGVGTFAMADKLRTHGIMTALVKTYSVNELVEYFDPAKNDPNDGWVHVSYSHDGNNRGNAMLINKNSNGYQPWEPTQDHMNRLKEIE